MNRELYRKHPSSSLAGYLRLIPAWQTAGYRVKLCFLKLPDAGFAIRRVNQRVRLGGHAIPQDTIRRRFARASARTASDPDFIGAEAALKRASAKAIERARRAGLQPVIMNPDDISTEAVLREDPTPYQSTRSKKRPKT